MKLDNRDLVLRGLLRILPTHLEPYTRRCLMADGGFQEGAAHPGADLGDLADLSTQIRILTARGADGRHLLSLPPGLGAKLHEVRAFRNEAVHGGRFDADRTLAALVAVSETLRLIDAPESGRRAVRELITAIDGAEGARDQDARALDAVALEVECPPVLGYAHAVAGQEFPIRLRLSAADGSCPPRGESGRFLLRSDGADGASGGGPDRVRGLPPGRVEARLTVIEHDGAHELTEPFGLSWDTSRPELTATCRLALRRDELLQVARAGSAEVRVELRGPTGERRTRSVRGLTCLAPRQWQASGGRRWSEPALAVFVQPAQAAVESLALSAWRGGGAAGPDELAGRVCALLRRRGVSIEEPPSPWEAGPQPVRTAAEVLDSRAATALDLSVLLAGVLERLGLRAALALTPGGAFPAYWRGAEAGGDAGLSPRGFAGLVERGVIGVIDPCLAACSGTALLHELRAPARRMALQALADVDVTVALDRLRTQGAVPQPALKRDEADVVVEVPADNLEPLAELMAERGRGAPEPAAPDEDPGPGAHGRAPSAPAGDEARAPEGPVPAKVEEWKRRLLDLSVRNPLIDRVSRDVIELKVPPGLLAVLEDLVNRRDTVKLRGIGPGEAGDPTAERLLEEQRIVGVGLVGNDYRQRLQSLATSAQTSLEETGSNNLHLALGTLVWRTDGRRLHSPLVLVPVNLEREGDTFGLVLDEAGVSTPNYSLLARFEADTGVDLEELRDPVRDAHGIDIRATVQALSQRLAGSGLDAVVEPTAHLGLFGFSTYRMWRDLDEHWQQLSANPVVARLMGSDGDPGPADGTGRAGEEHPAGGARPAGGAARACADLDLDSVVENLPLEADSSQARVVAEAVAGRSLVVEGPPGTGKSQTVANLIFRALAQGRTVMFVAAKASALDVVARRLREEAGIGDLILNLHDNGMKPSEVRAALRRALDVGGVEPGAGRAVALRARLADQRERLNRYRESLHAVDERGRSYYSARQEEVSADGAHREEARAVVAERASAAGLGTFNAAAHNAAIEDYRSTRAALRDTLRAELLDVVLHRREELFEGAGERADELRHEIGLRKPTMSVRELISRYGDLMAAITPCVLVSPDSVSRFFTAERAHADIVIFDEASQITEAGAVGAMGRGRSVVVVGDPRQMPPPRPAGAASARSGDLDGAPRARTESILDRCLAAGLARCRLTWHYRSRTESLIAFSNKRYYDGELLTFPSPLTLTPPDDGPGGHGISLRRVKGRYYQAGRARKRSGVVPSTNPIEAKQVVEEVRRRFEASADRMPSLGVITLNARQRDFIEDQLRETGSERIRQALEARDGLLVRNLDNVQGEERDTILLSLTFSAQANGVVPLNFGSLSHEGGERRLNVAITRARRQMVVFSSFDLEDLHVERSAHRGLKDLRLFLAQARSSGAPRALPLAPGDVDLNRVQIADRLREAGLEVRAGVGHSTFEIDLVLAPGGAPRSPGVAVLLDGPGWRRRGSVGDRDVLPVEVLTTMGWPHVERVWLPQWVADSQGVVDRLVEVATGCRPLRLGAGAGGGDKAPADGLRLEGTRPEEPRLEEPRPEVDLGVLSAEGCPAAEGAPPAEGYPAAGLEAVEASQGQEGSAPPVRAGAGTASDRLSAGPARDGAEEAVPAALARMNGPVDYRAWQAEGVRPRDVLDRAGTDPECRAQLVQVARAICEVEEPLTMHRLVVKICRAFDLSRTTAAREKKVREDLGQSFAYIDEHDFVWRTYDSSLVPVRYRRHALDHVESIEEIHPRELVALMTDVRRQASGWASPEDLCAQALRRLSARKRKLSAGGVMPALSGALSQVEDVDPEF